MLQVLAGVGEIHPEQLRISPRPGITNDRRDPHHVPAQGHHGVLKPRIPPQRGLMM